MKIDKITVRLEPDPSVTPAQDAQRREELAHLLADLLVADYRKYPPGTCRRCGGALQRERLVPPLFQFRFSRRRRQRRG